MIIALAAASTALTACTSAATPSGPPTTSAPTPVTSSVSAAVTKAPATQATTSTNAASSASAPSSAAPSDAAPTSAATLIRFAHAGRLVSATSYGVGALTADQPLQATRGSVEFETPSGNISCAILGSDPEVLCDVAHHSFATPPRPASCTLNYGPGYVSLSGSGVTQALCLGGPPIYPVSHTLAYGSALVVGTLACRSDAAFLACADTDTAHGFVVNRTRLQTY